MFYQQKKQGFTLVELLVVIAIIAVLATLVVTRLSDSRLKAKFAKAKADVATISKGMALLTNDTGKLLLGCPAGTSSTFLEGNLNGVGGPGYPEQIGIDSKPLPNAVPAAQRVAGVTYHSDLDNHIDNSAALKSECNWTTQDLQSWSGPYIKKEQLIDPWNNPYVFDGDYLDWPPKEERTSGAEVSEKDIYSAVLSFGPDNLSYTSGSYSSVIRSGVRYYTIAAGVDSPGDDDIVIRVQK